MVKPVKLSNWSRILAGQVHCVATVALSIALSGGLFLQSLQAQEAAAKTTIKLLFPLALFIAPAMGIVLLGPAMISIVKSFQRIF